MVIEELFNDPVTNLALDTLKKEKQALVFCNTRRGAASQAERVARKVKNVDLEDLSEKILKAVNSPTKQCKRLATCIKRGIAFHHAGLNGKQRHIIEDAFREGSITIICATPTLAMGMDLPAYRSIVRDLKRFSSGTTWGMANIPVLEFEQMAGRAGRPGKDDVGQAICIAKSEEHKEEIIETYFHGQPEEIYSKLAVEPVLRTYVLSLIAADVVKDKESLYGFFDETFYAYQYSDREKLHAILDKMVKLLTDWEFLISSETDDFVSADTVADGKLEATQLGERVAQLYLDPYTAYHILTSLRKSAKRKTTPKPFSLLHLICTTLEIRPLTRLRQAEYDVVDQELIKHESELFVKPPGMYSHEYDEFLQTIKTAMVLEAWIEEEGEDMLLEKYNVTPGELQAKRSIADWLLYSIIELVKIEAKHGLISHLERLRVRIEHGAKEEVIPLLRLKGIGRVRARNLFKHRIRTLGDLKKAEFSSLRKLLGQKIAIRVKEQVGQKVSPEDLKVKPRKRKGQINLADFS